MSTLNDQLTEDMKAAMKARDQKKLNVIRGLKAAVKNAAIEAGGADAVLDDVAVMAVIRKQIKQRQDSVEQYQNANRPELAETELEEIAVLETYLPQPLSEEEVDAIVDQAIASTGATAMADMGKVMGEVQKLAEGRADGKVLSQKVRAKLA
ncbi:GatB/YqeY domain-containing protein [Sulfuriroseicoccus oceanibius]|uniref:GatB/YqeY domain-containing protein n=1 Tax=Sulfuriroseicoccus oceanibius TaxID=2707525 RepID=A0A6B3LEW9_9BACT|nr:GatB/YqeY domain-containing protein [Sulfuriroseicoccus oceanibius]QQL45098.1 GatB/YqeY domain-containing protein [Sulfuriroseicoccus oceanibius]